MSTEGFEKLLHIVGDLEGSAHGQSCANARESPNLSPLADLEALLKQKVKTKVVF